MPEISNQLPFNLCGGLLKPIKRHSPIAKNERSDKFRKLPFRDKVSLSSFVWLAEFVTKTNVTLTEEYFAFQFIGWIDQRSLFSITSLLWFLTDFSHSFYSLLFNNILLCQEKKNSTFFKQTTYLLLE